MLIAGVGYVNEMAPLRARSGEFEARFESFDAVRKAIADVPRGYGAQRTRAANWTSSDGHRRTISG
jgi:hypothetical protein